VQRPTSWERSKGRVGVVLALAVAVLVVSGGADGGPAEAGAGGFDYARWLDRGERIARSFLGWYERTPPADRLAWGGLGACAVLGLGVLVERSGRLRVRRLVPREFTARFLPRLLGGKLDRAKALDYCELNPSPAARVVLAAVRRWDRAVADQERAAALAIRVEGDRLRRNVSTLRRIAALAPLVGLLGTLSAAGRALSAGGADVVPALGMALRPLTAGVALAILALVAYDGLSVRVEKLVGMLESLAAEAVDAIALAAPAEAWPARTPHSVRIEPYEQRARVLEHDADDR
jgi:biopolymer transport protein ExbB